MFVKQFREKCCTHHKQVSKQTLLFIIRISKCYNMLRACVHSLKLLMLTTVILNQHSKVYIIGKNGMREKKLTRKLLTKTGTDLAYFFLGGQQYLVFLSTTTNSHLQDLEFHRTDLHRWLQLCHSTSTVQLMCPLNKHLECHEL